MSQLRLDRIDNNPVHQRRESAWAQVRGIFDVDRTVRDLAMWFQKAVGKCKDAASLEQLSAANLLAHPVSVGVPAGGMSASIDDSALHIHLAEAITALLRGESHEWKDIAAILYGKAVASVLVREIEDQEAIIEPRAMELYSLGSHNDIIHLELVESLAKAIRIHRRVCTAYLEWLERRIARINECPGESVYSKERETFIRFVHDWLQRPLLNDLWRDAAGAHFSVDFDDLDMVIPVLMAEPAGTLSRLDKLRFPQPLEQILLHRSIWNDSSLVAKLLRCAPSCTIEGNEKDWNGSLLTVLLLKAVDDQCRSLWQIWFSQQEAFDDDEASRILSSWIADLAAIVMGRKDGGFLGIQWLLLKAMDERMKRSSQSGPDILDQTNMIEWIGAGLNKAGLTGSMIAKYVDFPSSMDRGKLYKLPSSSGSGDRSPCLSALAMMVMIDCMIGDDWVGASSILAQLDDLLKARDQGFKEEAIMDVGTTGLPASCMGRLLANESEPSKRWKQSWHLLAEQRRAIQHWRKTKDSDAMAPSLFLIASGIAALDWLCSEGIAHEADPRELWRELFDTVRECWLTIQVTHLSERLENDIRRLFARHSMIFDSPGAKEAPRQNSPYSKLLANDLNTLGGDDELMAACCEFLYRNGISLPMLHQTLQHDEGRGYALLDQFIKWQEVERSAKKNPGLVQAVSEMRKKIDAVVS